MHSNRIAIIFTQIPMVDKMTANAMSCASALELEVVSKIICGGALEQPIKIKQQLMNDNVDGVVVLGILRKGNNNTLIKDRSGMYG